MLTLTVALLGFLGVVATALGVWLASLRKMSGRVRSSDAATIFDAAEVLRKETRADLDDTRRLLHDSNGRLVAVEGRMATVEQNNNALTLENIELRKGNQEYEQIIADLQIRLNTALAEIKALKEQVAELVAALATEKKKPKEVGDA